MKERVICCYLRGPSSFGPGLHRRESAVEPLLASSSVTSATERRELLKAVYEEARGCVRCPLHRTRTTVVFGSGNADAELMFIGEAPGANEDKQGLPFVGQAGKLLDKLLCEIGLERSDVFIANTVKCRPPSNRDPHPNEIESCNGHLRSQVQLDRAEASSAPWGISRPVAARGDSTGISRLHGRDEVRTMGPSAVRLLPLWYHLGGRVVHALHLQHCVPTSSASPSSWPLTNRRSPEPAEAGARAGRAPVGRLPRHLQSPSEADSKLSG